MNKKKDTESIFESIKNGIILMFSRNEKFSDERARINKRRILFLSAFAFPGFVVFTIMLLFSPSSDNKLWTDTLTILNGSMALVWAFTFIYSLSILNRQLITKPMRMLPEILFAGVMLYAIMVVTVDQLAVTSITPLFFASIAVGALILTSPIYSALVYVFSYIVYYFAIALTVTDPSILLSNRINGIIAIFMGLLLSLMMYSYNLKSLNQKEKIEQQRKQLEHMAYHDQLTGLYNRHYFKKAIKEQAKKMTAEGYESAIIMLDLDDFKSVNDLYGHNVGDTVLQLTAQLLSDNIRKNDTLTRYGGEEFSIILPKTSVAQAVELAERLRNTVSKHLFVTTSVKIRLTASFGVAALKYHDCNSPEDCYTLVDRALYNAKKNGKNRVEFV